MQRLKVTDADIKRTDVLAEIRRTRDARYNHRLHGVLLVTSGLSCYDVAKLFGRSPRTVEEWIKRFEKYGLAGLQEQARPGRPETLTDQDTEAIRQALQHSPMDLGYKKKHWDGMLLSQYLADNRKVKLGVRQCQRIITKIGFRKHENCA